MRRFAITIALLATVVAFPARELRGTGPTKVYPVPEGGSVSRGAYRNEYFGFVYPLPAGWVEDVKGPPPSATGYYALAAFKPRDSLVATLLIAAQDNFFGSRPMATATDFLDQMKRQLVPLLSTESPPIRIAGQSLARLDYAGAGLHHVVLATDIRCHTVIFSLTSGSVEQIDNLLASISKITFSAKTSPGPICVAEYATADRILHRVKPAPAGPRFSSIPVRIIIDARGVVENVHPIGGLPEQAQSVREALLQWRFRPYLHNGKPIAIETGVIVQFTGDQ